MDGVLVDSEEFICKAAIMMFSENGINASPDDFRPFVGMGENSDVERKKPFPDIYLKASEMTGLKPGECLVVEDAVSGVKAAKSAGCRCLAVTTSFAREALHEADWICNSLSDAPEEALKW